MRIWRILTNKYFTVNPSKKIGIEIILHQRTVVILCNQFPCLFKMLLVFQFDLLHDDKHIFFQHNLEIDWDWVQKKQFSDELYILTGFVNKPHMVTLWNKSFYEKVKQKRIWMIMTEKIHHALSESCCLVHLLINVIGT